MERERGSGRLRQREGMDREDRYCEVWRNFFHPPYQEKNHIFLV